MNPLNLHTPLFFKFSVKRLLAFFTLAVLLLHQHANAQVPLLYGTSAAGGADSLGSIYNINGDGSGFNTIYSFSYATGSGPLVITMVFYNNNFYGTTSVGGADSFGVIFSFNPVTHTYTDLFNFNKTNGSAPTAGLTLAGGIFYGVTSAGGANGMGVVFSFNPVSSAYTDIFDFDSVHGTEPYGQLTLASNGTLYGGTVTGGASNDGVIYSVTPPATFQKIFDFDGTDGWEVPYGYGLTDAGNGKLYGVTYEGGANNLGVVYTLNEVNNTYLKIYDFDSVHGAFPATGLTLANNILYGTCSGGGANNTGTLFSINPSQNDTVIKLHDFNTLNDGTMPVNTLLQASDGKLYATAYMGGANSDGTIFNFDPSTNLFTKIHDCTQLDNEPTGGLSEILPTGIASITNHALITVSPNPTADMAILHFPETGGENYNLILSDVTGRRLMLQENITATGNQNLSVDLSGFSTGIYFLNILAADGRQVQCLKLVKQ